MPSLVTEKARVMTAVRMRDSFQSNNLLNHYMVAAKHVPFDDDNNPPMPVNSDDFQYYDMARDIIFGKKITPDDVATAIKNYTWQSGTIYTAYDDKDGDLYKKKFYAITKEGAEYSVFKCLYNNKGKPSTFQPKKSETNIADELYLTNDGYIWKLLYSVSENQYKKFAIGQDVFPCFANPDATENAVDGAIHAIITEFGGSGYNTYANGSFRTIAVNGNNLIHAIQSDGVLSANTDYYKSCAIHINAGTGAGQLRQIEEYIVTGSDRRILLKNAFTVDPDFSSKFAIAPFVQIEGDGQGAEAVVTINATSNAIHSVQMVRLGEGYTVANATIIANPSTLSANSATVRAILSPQGGHGYDVEKELFASRMVISSQFDGNEGGVFSTDNDYRITAVMVDPVFANTVVTVADITGFTAEQKVTQNNGMSATISAVNLDGANTIRLKNIKGIVEVGETIVASNTSNSSIASADVTLVDRDLTKFDNRSVYSVEAVTPLSEFVIDEKIVQSSTGAYGYLHSVSGNTMFLTGVVGTFSVSDFTVGFEAEFVGESSDAVAKITGFNRPSLVKTAGECIYIQTTTPVERADDQAERLKVLIEF
ncbi:baseplate wedge subunit [Sinorhizobium phage phiM12]|uniref:Baseplate wedge subunit n=2 Tax=Emdodecavirus TaxID=1980937 RepID=S5M6T0_9CAUD|nr:baseplate wedge subunit [Sinorhizobium phage phiM12]YP_009212346.1 baseplate wedge subunit [Sinorhizobium phage phiN3]AGR47766.1 baseplate wedge subunit [Sinorhizobium phage phiM12]AKF12998.1 baseplate wedge subunit [Sinorhizobium phage phiM19]AKF13371.1 baseplate wedge subunit [Sinorhizobium phage phiN3]